MEESKPDNNAKVKKAGSKERKGNFARKTTETDIKLSLNIDGKGAYEIDSGVPFFNHMLEQFSKHSGFDIHLKAKGDIGVDLHHLIEDTGIVIGSALMKLSGDKKGIKRFGFASVPMDEALVQSSVDFCGRSFFVYKFMNEDMSQYVKESSPSLFSISKQESREILVDKFFYVYSNIFFEALCKNALINLHINIQYGSNAHHMVEAIFKSTGRALSDALKIVDNRGIPSTKGSI
jgi:imidazoleglycerol-phosphate dehydratase